MAMTEVKNWMPAIQPWLCEVIEGDHRCGRGAPFTIQVDNRKYYICQEHCRQSMVRFVQ